MRTLAMTMAFLSVAACGSEDGDVPTLPGTERSDIPVFAPSQLESDEPVSYSVEIDFEDVDHITGHSWTFSTNRAVTELFAFYEPLAAPVAAAPQAAEDEDLEIDPGAEGWDDEDFGDEDSGDSEDSGATGGKPGPALDGAGRTFRLVQTAGSELEVTVYLQPRQRRTWFSILETRTIDKP